MEKIYIFSLYVIFFLAPTFGSLCPLDDHVVCNNDNKLHKCVCAVPEKPEEPIPEQSCNRIVDVTDEDFEAVSITFDLKDFVDDKKHLAQKHDNDDEKEEKDKNNDEDKENSESIEEEDEEEDDGFDQEKFRKEISQLLHIEESRIVIIRISCIDKDEKLTVQFVVLKPNTLQKSVTKSKKIDENNDDDSKESTKDEDDEHEAHNHEKDDGNDEEEDKEIEFKPYELKDLMDSEKIADELKARRATATKFADLDVVEIESVHKLEEIEQSSNNTLLLFEALAVIFGITLTCFLACYFTCKKCRKNEEYLDTLQKA